MKILELICFSSLIRSDVFDYVVMYCKSNLCTMKTRTKGTTKTISHSI